MTIGSNTWRYLSAGLRGGPMAVLDTADELQRERKKHQRRKALRGTPRTLTLKIDKKGEKKEDKKQPEKKKKRRNRGVTRGSQLSNLLD